MPRIIVCGGGGSVVSIEGLGEEGAVSEASFALRVVRSVEMAWGEWCLGDVSSEVSISTRTVRLAWRRHCCSLVRLEGVDGLKVLGRDVGGEGPLTVFAMAAKERGPSALASL